MSRSKVEGQGHRGQIKTEKCGTTSFGSRPLGRRSVQRSSRAQLRRWEYQRMLSCCSVFFNFGMKYHNSGMF